MQEGPRYVSGYNPTTGWGMPPGSFIPNIGPTLFNPYNYYGMTASWVPHDDGVTWPLVDNNFGVIQQILIPNSKSTIGQQNSQAQPFDSQLAIMGTTNEKMQIQPVHQQIPQGSAPQPNHWQSPAQPEVPHPHAQGQC